MQENKHQISNFGTEHATCRTISISSSEQCAMGNNESDFHMSKDVGK